MSSVIFLVMPLHRKNDKKPNKHNYILKDVTITLKEIGYTYRIPVLDLFGDCNFYPENSKQNDQLSGDGLHPNQWYHENVLGPKVANFIRSLM